MNGKCKAILKVPTSGCVQRGRGNRRAHGQSRRRRGGNVGGRGGGNGFGESSQTNGKAAGRGKKKTSTFHYWLIEAITQV